LVDAEPRRGATPRRRDVRKIIAIAIILFWACMMYSLMVKYVIPQHRENRSSLMDPLELAIQWVDIDEWNWIRQNNKTLGASRLTIVKNFDNVEQAPAHNAYVLIQNMDVHLKLPMVGLDTPFKTKMTVHLTRDFRVSRFAGSASLPMLSMDVLGRIEETKLYYRVIRNRGEPIYGILELKEPLSLLSAVEPMICHQSDLKVGQSFTQEVLNPLGGMKPLVAKITVAKKEDVEVNGKLQSLFRVETTIGEMTKSRWVNERGETQRADLFMGLVAERGSGLAIKKQFPELGKEKFVPLDEIEGLVVKVRENAGKAGSGPSPESLERILEPLLGGPR
jgi:hypothetical protein